MAHPLLEVMTHAAAGAFPPVDGAVSFLPALEDGNRAIVALTGHTYVACGLSADDFDGIPLDGFGQALAPAAVLRVADGGVIGVNYVTLTAPGTGTGDRPDRRRCGMTTIACGTPVTCEWTSSCTATSADS
jgi:hypothetical protein